nr:X-linked retinitis pigmentosa GTPase regulator-like [Anolis sagrei ordinatus]
MCRFIIISILHLWLYTSDICDSSLCFKNQTSEKEESGSSGEEEEVDSNEKEVDKHKGDEQDAVEHNDNQTPENAGHSNKSIKSEKENQVAIETLEDEISSGEEEIAGGSDEGEDDKKEDRDKEEQNTAKHKDNHTPEDVTQSSKSCESEENNHMTTETIEKEGSIPDENATKQESEKTELHATNCSSSAIESSQDRTTGGLLDKAKRFSFFKRKSSRQKDARNGDENKLEKLPQSEQEAMNQVTVSDVKSKDENQNHSGGNQRELPPANRDRKSSSTCLVL